MDAEGVPHQALRQARVSDTLAMSQLVFDEIAAVLRRPRLARFVDATQPADRLDQLVSGSTWFEPLVAVADCRDMADNKYLELALAEKAAALCPAISTCLSCTRGAASQSCGRRITWRDHDSPIGLIANPTASCGGCATSGSRAQTMPGPFGSFCPTWVAGSFPTS